MVQTTKTQKHQFKTMFSELFANYDKGTSQYGRKFVVAVCWVGYYTAAFLAVLLFVPGLLFKAAKTAYRVTKEGRA
jgi:hypothetical protein